MKRLPGSILVVDDDENNRDLLASNLEWEGHTVSMACDGQQALDLIRAQPFDLVLLDIMMPVMDGYQVLACLQADPLLCQLPVLVISAADDLASVVRCIELGAEDYLAKPFNRILLKARVDSCLEKKRLRDQEQAYIISRLGQLNDGLHRSGADSDFPSQLALPSQAELTGMTQAAGGLLDALERALLERQQAEDALKALNVTLEQRVAERTAAAEQRAKELAQSEAALRESEERYAIAARAANDGLWDWDLKTNQVYYSSRWKGMLGLAEHEVGTSIHEWLDRLHADDREQVQAHLAAHLKGLITHFEREHRMLHADGTYRWMLCRGLGVWDATGQVVRMAGSQSDITQRKQAEQQLLHDALHDTLTGLPNRALFMDRLERMIARDKRNEQAPFAVLFLDLDRFKIVNDSLGHAVGDQLLIAIARGLEMCLRAGDTVARLGGDEFTILLEDLSDISDAGRVAERIQQALSVPFILNGQEVFTSASIGITLSTIGYERADDVLRDADTAMYHAKLLGKARYALFDTNMHAHALARLQLETDLRRAIERQEFQVYYQPIVSLGSGQITGFEALVRWQHPQRGMISPDQFIPIAEETGLIIAIDRWVLREACAQMQAWQAQVREAAALSVNVNISAKQFAQPDLVAYIQQILGETGLSPQSLKLEITESTIIKNGDYAMSALAQLRAGEVQICIDDFGTGYSSLSYLHQFPVDAVKIDRSFVNRIGAAGEKIEVIQTIIALAHTMGMDAIAEGTETTVQLAHLKQLGCGYVQGWLFSRAVDSLSAAALLTGDLGDKIEWPQDPVYAR